jgi:hypothetical protein|tara:strand:+ start:1158 stop:1397 length:240 start_codon:yes stop_codon:yes gene_type:complete
LEQVEQVQQDTPRHQKIEDSKVATQFSHYHPQLLPLEEEVVVEKDKLVNLVDLLVVMETMLLLVQIVRQVIVDTLELQM